MANTATTYIDAHTIGDGIIQERLDCWRWSFRWKDGVPGAEQYEPGRPILIMGFSTSRELAIEHLQRALEKFR